MSYSQILQDHPYFVLTGLALLGLIVGSFLNVVILRLPQMMERQWKRACREVLEIASPEGEDAEEAHFNLAFPGSHCPGCQAPIAAWQNIPVLSYLLLRGRCAACRNPIGLRYPIVEMMSGVMTLAVALHADSWLTLGALLLLSWSLLVLAVIDFDTQLLPDDITLPLLWAGLLYNLLPGPVSIADAVSGAAAGYLLLWSIYWLFKIVTGKEGMGYGDFKLLAALGAWLGWQSIPLIILLSSLVGALLGIALIVLQGRDRAQPMPFGPYLAAAGWISALWGPELLVALNLSGP